MVSFYASIFCFIFPGWFFVLDFCLFPHNLCSDYTSFKILGNFDIRLHHAQHEKLHKLTPIANMCTLLGFKITAHQTLQNIIKIILSARAVHYLMWFKVISQGSRCKQNGNVKQQLHCHSEKPFMSCGKAKLLLIFAWSSTLLTYDWWSYSLNN